MAGEHVLPIELPGLWWKPNETLHTMFSGATFVTQSEVCGGELSHTPRKPHVLRVRESQVGTSQSVSNDDEQAFNLTASYVVNAAGLWAQQVSKSLIVSRETRTTRQLID